MEIIDLREMVKRLKRNSQTMNVVICSTTSILVHKFRPLNNRKTELEWAEPVRKNFSMVAQRLNPYINNKTDRTLYVVFSILKNFFSFIITEDRSPKELREGSVRLQDREREHARYSFGLLDLQGYCEQKTLNLEKTTSSALFALL